MSAPEVAPVRSTNVRRSMVTMSAALWALSTPLGAQSRGAWTLGFAGTRSPFPQGSPWGALTVLPGLKFGDPDGVQIGLLLGPTFFFGQASDVRAFLGIRFEAPLARREPHP